MVIIDIDIDGVLDDPSAHDAVLADKDMPPAQRWLEFFDHIPAAAVIGGGHDLVWAVEGLGYTVVYTTTDLPRREVGEFDRRKRLHRPVQAPLRCVYCVAFI